MNAETWKSVVGYEGVYEVSDAGNVRRLYGRKTASPLRLVKPWARKDGRLTVGLWRENCGKKRLVHHLVLEAFAGPRPAGMECCHNDGNCKNNAANNLRWDTKKSNFEDNQKHGVYTWRCTWQRARGERSAHTHLIAEDVVRIREASLYGAKPSDLAKIYRISKVGIHRIKTREVWAHVA